MNVDWTKIILALIGLASGLLAWERHDTASDAEEKAETLIIENGRIFKDWEEAYLNCVESKTNNTIKKMAATE